jgi:hypothetical protein
MKYILLLLIPACFLGAFEFISHESMKDLAEEFMLYEKSSAVNIIEVCHGYQEKARRLDVLEAVAVYDTGLNLVDRVGTKTLQISIPNDGFEFKRIGFFGGCHEFCVNQVTV